MQGEENNRDKENRMNTKGEEKRGREESGLGSSTHFRAVQFNSHIHFCCLQS